MTHICVSELTIIGSDNGLSPGQRQAIIWTNAGILLIGPLGTNVSEILIEILTFSFKKMRLKVSSGKWRPSCLGLNVLSSFPWLFLILQANHVSQSPTSSHIYYDNVILLYIIDFTHSLSYIHNFASHTLRTEVAIRNIRNLTILYNEVNICMEVLSKQQWIQIQIITNWCQVTHMHQWTWSSMAHVMAFCLFGAKP